MDIRQVVHITLADEPPKIIDGYWHEWVNGEWINTGVKAEAKDGSNYLILGFFSDKIQYKLSPAGIPVVKRSDGTQGNFSVFELTAPQSTFNHVTGKGTFVPSEWKLVESADFIYMQDAYIERLQAVLVTAERIEALDIVHPSGLYSLVDGKLKVKDATIDGLLKVSSGYQGKIGDYNLFWIAPMPRKTLTVPTTFDSKGKTIKFYNASSTVSHTLNLLVIGYLLNSKGEVVLTNYTISDEEKGARKDSVFIPPRGCVEVSCFELPPGNYKSTGDSSRTYDRVLSWEMTNRETYVTPQ